ncbi:MAG TPA: C25 family cysteine peptidase [bacterium]|nr:C25 family cysteine peptidase [bacterium]
MRPILLVLLTALTVLAEAATLDIETGPLSFRADTGGVIPILAGFSTESVGGKPMLPYRVHRFSTPVERVDILSSETLSLPASLQEGRYLYRLAPDGLLRVDPPAALRVLPTRENFHRTLFAGDRRGEPVHEFRWYPVVRGPNGGYIHIKKIRLHFADALRPRLLPADQELPRKLLLLTSNETLARSTQLSPYVEAKRRSGWTVDIATEDQFGADGLTGTKRAVAIREWLKTVYKKYGYLLLLGDPRPEMGDIPMLRTYANNDEPEVSYHDVPTDFFYGELTNDWDSNDNGQYAESEDGFLGFNWELLVGRIPVYAGGMAKVDRILERTIAYMAEDPGAADYRRKALFPAGIPYYENQDGMGNDKMDGGYVVRQMLDTFFSGRSDLTTRALVEKEGLAPSEFTDWGILESDQVVNEWNDGYGLVYWLGHGLSKGAYRTIWTGDNGDGVPSSYELSSPSFIDSGLADALPADRAAFVYMGSCLNGDVDEPDNIATAMLYQTAVGVVAASQVSYGGIWPEYEPEYAQDVFAYGTVFTRAVLEGKSPARVLADQKILWTSDSVMKTIKLELNYFGDPTLTNGLRTCTQNDECDDGLFCNGVEECRAGWCALASPPPACSAAENECAEMVCDEESRACVTVAKKDGVSCTEGSDKCFTNYLCKAGVCVAQDPVDCSDIEGLCIRGACDPATGQCEVEAINEGESCDDGLYCTVDTVCSAGECVGADRSCEETAPACRKVQCDEGTQSCISLQDLSQNSLSCQSDTGIGSCSYGECVISEENKVSEAEDRSDNGCAMILAY